MIKYEEGIERVYCKSSSVEKERNKLLEKALRLLGNFKENEPILVTEFKENGYDVIYTVKDADNNTFTFHNFNLDYDVNSNKRFRESYYLYLQRENSKMTYKYDFDELDYNDYKQEIRLIEIIFNLPKNRILSLERKIHHPIRIKIKEQDKDKEYILGYHNYSEDHDLYLLENFNSIIEKAKNIEKLNIENILKLVPDLDKVSFFYIKKQDAIIASIQFHKGNIFSYEIIDDTKNIKVTVDDKIKRDVKRKGFYSYEETITDNYEKIQMEINRLMKTL